MALLQRAETKQARADGCQAVKVFWSGEDISDGDLQRAEACIRKANFSARELHDLRADLPLGATGTTGARVMRIDRVLKRLEKEAGQ